MTSPTTLFIGGTADGQRMAVPAHLNHYQVAKPADQCTPGLLTFAGEFDTYRPVSWYDHRVFVLDGMSPAEAMGRLIDNYKP